MSAALAMSLACPAVSLSWIGRPCASTRAWILVVSPPRERPTQRSRPPFSGRPLLVDPHDRGVDHLDVAVVSLCDRVHQPIPDAGFAPAVEAIVDRRRWAVASRDIRPGRTRPKHPEDTVQDPPIIDPRHAARLVGKLRLDRRPLEIAEFVASHRQAPLSELESRNRRRWNRPDGLMGLRPNRAA